MIHDELRAFELDSYTAVNLEGVTVATLAKSIDEGDAVEYDADGHIGVVVAKLTSPFEWPESDDEIEASEENPIYIVALETGGSKPFEASELSPIGVDDAFGAVEDEADPEKLDEAEMGSAYTELDEEELINLPGVKDPHVGFDRFPPSWRESEQPARVIALHAWVKMGATWRGCYREIKSKRLCSAFKDEILGTTRWRAWD